MTSKEIKIMSDKKYWDEIYYSNLKESEKDFLNDIWMEKYNDIICNVTSLDRIVFFDNVMIFKCGVVWGGRGGGF